MLIGLLILICVIIIGIIRKGKTCRHSYYRKKARKIYRRITSKGLAPGQVVAYLRKINPYVFEELVLDGFEKSGYKVTRNKRYSGDGGIDGRVSRDGKEYFVQCKRYKNHIDPQHVAEFARICDENGRAGYFVHTGKTGRKSKMNAYYGNVEVISGDKLIKLIHEDYGN